MSEAHRAALKMLDGGDVEKAHLILRSALGAVIDPEALNDLAVLAVRAGDTDEACDLLRALVYLHPQFADARQNLAALGGPDAGVSTTARERATEQDNRRERFFDVIADALPTVLADNVDYLFEPWGHESPASGHAGRRIAEQLAILDRATMLWRSFGDEDSRSLFLRFLAYRALGSAHVRLQLEPKDYRQAVIGLTARALAEPYVVRFQGMPFEWQLHRYDLRAYGLPITVIGPPLPLASTMIFSQYAYRNAAVAARPRTGDVALDVGGCWGDTALWLAHMVGETGHVHTFEPTPGNRRLLEQNRELNPSLGPRITVWSEPLSAQPGETVWLPDVIGAGATMRDASDCDGGRPEVELRTQSVDAFVEAGRIPRVDFIKVDVEGADLGVLEGAARTIREHRPRLAVACYHKPDDLVTVPDLIARIGANYSWYLQCSTMTDVDTVAFGVPE